MHLVWFCVHLLSSLAPACAAAGVGEGWGLSQAHSRWRPKALVELPVVTLDSTSMGACVPF